MKIRIFALAKEMGLDSKDLIQSCNDAGLGVKSSLATITPEERDILLAHLKKVGSGASGGGTVAESSLLTREETRPVAPVREMRDLGPLAGQMRTRRPPRKDSANSPDEIEETVTVAVEELAPPPEAPPVVETVDEEPPPAAPPEETLPAETVAPAAEVRPAPERPVPPKPVDALETMRPRSPITRSDYIGPGGSAGASTIREMKPHGSVRSPDTGNRRDKKRGPALPSLAQPNFKPPVAKKSDEPVQKPELALTGDVLKKNKLSEILKKNRDDASRRTPTVEEDEPAAAKGRSSARGLSLEEAREARRKKRQRTRTGTEDDDMVVKTAKRHRRQSGAVERKSAATVTFPITIRSLSEAMGRPARDLITVLFKQGQAATINDTLEEETALEIAMELGVELAIEREADFEDLLAQRIASGDAEEQAGTMQPRPPIITVLGHVDHGKTTLVDRLRSSNVVAGEAGGITQHIAAYQVEHNGHKLTFVDTPGHAAFGEMRARGANVTDIIVLVVAADDGVMPQTVECISHAKAANVPIVVAMNKIDLPNVNQQKVLTELSQHGILPSEWGGDVEVVRVSGLVGTGLDDLLETLIVTAELNELKAAADIPADGVCLEAFRDEGRGPLAWMIVRQGTLRVGDLVLCGPAYGRVRAMYTDREVEIQEAGPSTPVKIAGLSSVPGAGDHLYVMDDIEEAREYAEERQLRGRAATLSGRGGPMSLEEFFAAREAGVKDLALILKADTPGSIEAIRGELEKIEHPEVRIKVLHTGVGGVNESDVYLAASTGAIVIAFHVVAEDRAESLASQEGVEIRRYKIIYNLTEDIRKALEGLLEPEKVEVSTGRAIVLRTFPISRVGTVAGCRVINGSIDRTNRVHVIRDQTILNSYPIASLKREKDDVREVREGYECGIRLEGFNDVKEGDLLEAYRIEERKRTLDE